MASDTVELVQIDDPRFRITPVQQMGAACTGALLTSIIMTPLDVVKIRLQAQQKLLTASKCFTYCNGLMERLCPCTDSGEAQWYRRPAQFKGTLDAFVKIWRSEGVCSLWSGLSPTLVLAVPTTVVYFVTYEQLRNRLNDYYGRPGWVPLVSGCVARFWAVSTFSPLELVRTNMQSKRLSYLEVHQALQSLLQYHGYKGLWTGLSATLCRDVPFSGIYWVTYEYMKTINPDLTCSFWFSFVTGSVSGTIAALITTPFDVVKTHRQVELAERILKKPQERHKKSTLAILRHIYVQNGMRGMFVGFVPRVVKIAPACAIMVSTFEYGKMYFQLYNMKEYNRRLEEL